MKTKIIFLGCNNHHIEFGRIEAAKNIIIKYRYGIHSIILSGGIVDEKKTSEASRMKHKLDKTLIQVPHIEVQLEEQSTNTEENIQYTLPMLSAPGTESIVFCSSEWHIPRINDLVRRILPAEYQPHVRYALAEEHIHDTRLTEHKGWKKLQKKYKNMEIIREIPGAKTAIKILQYTKNTLQDNKK